MAPWNGPNKDKVLPYMLWNSEPRADPAGDLKPSTQSQAAITFCQACKEPKNVTAHRLVLNYTAC